MLTEIEVCKLEGVKVLKLIHGYGSHGKGGSICMNVRKKLFALKKQHIIKDFLLGNEWDLSNPKCIELMLNLKLNHLDEDLNHQNGGITFVIL